MAVVNYEIEQVNPKVITVTWKNLANNDTGQPLHAPGYVVLREQKSGTNGSGPDLHVIVQGTVSEANQPWVNVSDSASLPSQNNTYMFGNSVRPTVTGGDGSTDANVTLVLVPVAEPESSL